MTNQLAPTISVMMPCYNNAAFIEQAVSSVLNQTVECSFELVIVDDASSDDSVKRIEAFGDARIRLIQNQQNTGIAAVRNQLLELASGQYFTSLDGDDLYVDSCKLATELALMQQSESVRPTIVYSDIELMDAGGKRVRLASRSMPPHEGIIFQGLLDRRIMIPRDFLMPADLAISVGGFDQSLSIYEDWDYKLRLAQKASFRYTGQIGIGYRRHGSGLSATSGRVHRRHISRIRRKFGIEAYDGDPIRLMKSLRRADRIARTFARSRAA